MEKFIKIGSTRIKKSNIKHYGVYTKSKRFPNGKTFGLLQYLRGSNSYSYETDEKTIKYLRIETFQNEMFDFDEDDHDIYRAVSELDAESHA